MIQKVAILVNPTFRMRRFALVKSPNGRRNFRTKFVMIILDLKVEYLAALRTSLLPPSSECKYFKISV